MTVLVERRGPVTVVTIDRLDKRNSIDGETTLALDAAFNDFEDDPSALVAVLTGGPQIFCAGTDVVSWAGTPTERGGNYGIAGRRMDKPLIAAVEGVAAGGGFEIALSANLIVASTAATFAFPEVRLGLVAECGGLFRGPRALPLNVGRELLLTGLPITAQRGYELGLVNRLTEPGKALEEALALAEHIAALAPIAIRESMRVIEAQFAEADTLGWDTTGVASRSVRASEDAVEGVAAFKARRAPEWHNR
jgi:enoyl-CoA hydratase/carnithine racemase